uniref:RGS domain-containing protein n=1 Tax=Macrostomum lignano TaxID=282301 RepID=A0A1I8IZQ7_9PLAT
DKGVTEEMTTDTLNQLVANSALRHCRRIALVVQFDVLENLLTNSTTCLSALLSRRAAVAAADFLHDTKNEDGIRHFFSEMFETYVKLALNPFYQPQSPIKSAAFDRKAQHF